MGNHLESDAREWGERRARLRVLLGPGTAALVSSPPVARRNADNEYRYRPDSTVVYLSGFEEPEAVLLLLPEGHATEFVMFVPQRDPAKERWTGLRAGVDGACARYGADAAHPLDELAERLGEYLEPLDELALPFEDSEALLSCTWRVLRTLGHRKNRPVGGPRTLRDLRLILGDMRLHKSPAEIAIMRQAGRISAAGHHAAMGLIAPGAGEWEVEAAINHTFRRAGANGPAYETIVGSGANATILHYISNDAIIGPDQAVLVDAGAEYRFYSGDITRTYPSSGRFTDAQRNLYRIVLEAEKRAIEACRVGNHVRKPHELAVATIVDGLLDLGLLEGDPAAIIEEQAYTRFYMHGTSHFLGLDTHDAGESFSRDGNPRALGAGMVLTVEPGIYVSPDDARVPEAYRGIGVRIEDDILVTADGPENLTTDAPKELSDIEH